MRILNERHGGCGYWAGSGVGDSFGSPDVNKDISNHSSVANPCRGRQPARLYRSQQRPNQQEIHIAP